MNRIKIYDSLDLEKLERQIKSRDSIIDSLKILQKDLIDSVDLNDIKKELAMCIKYNRPYKGKIFINEWMEINGYKGYSPYFGYVEKDGEKFLRHEIEEKFNKEQKLSGK